MAAAQVDMYQLAVGVLYLNLGLASLEFPTTTRSHPSSQVQVVLQPKRLPDESHRCLFPFFVRWDIWQRVVVPVFEDGSVLVKVPAELNETLRQQINRGYILAGDYPTLLRRIAQLLLTGMIQCGYVPADAVLPE